MLDPWTALTLAGNIVQFVDFGTKVIVEGRSLYKSTTGLSSVNQELEFVADEVHKFVGALRRPLTQAQSPPSIPDPTAQQDQLKMNISAMTSQRYVTNAKRLQKTSGNESKVFG
jgi:hypothetical protein